MAPDEFGVGERLKGEEFHAKALAAQGDGLADAAQSGEAEGTAAQGKGGLAGPGARFRLVVLILESFGQREEEGEGVFGDRVVVGARSDRDRDAVFGGGG